MNHLRMHLPWYAPNQNIDRAAQNALGAGIHSLNHTAGILHDNAFVECGNQRAIAQLAFAKVQNLTLFSFIKT